MKNMTSKKFLLLASISLLMLACTPEKTPFSVDRALESCHQQVEKTLLEIGSAPMMPRNILSNQTAWNLIPVSVEDWTVGFWSGVLWYNYENTRSEADKQAAIRYTELLQPLTTLPAYDHDLGFQLFCSGIHIPFHIFLDVALQSRKFCRRNRTHF